MGDNMEKEESLALEMLRELKAQARRWFIIAIIELLLIVATNICWFLYNSQFEEIIEEETMTQEQIETENSNMSGVIN